MKMPALGHSAGAFVHPSFLKRSSRRSTKFLYFLLLRKTPIGSPLAAITPSSRVQVPSGLAAADQNSDRSAFGISETKPSACAQVKAGTSNMTTTSTNIGLFLQSGLAKVSDQHVIQRCVGFYHCLELPLPRFRRMLAFGAVRQIRTGRC